MKTQVERQGFHRRAVVYAIGEQTWRSGKRRRVKNQRRDDPTAPNLLMLLLAVLLSVCAILYVAGGG